MEQSTASSGLPVADDESLTVQYASSPVLLAVSSDLCSLLSSLGAPPFSCAQHRAPSLTLTYTTALSPSTTQPKPHPQNRPHPHLLLKLLLI